MMKEPVINEQPSTLFIYNDTAACCCFFIAWPIIKYHWKHSISLEVWTDICIVAVGIQVYTPDNDVLTRCLENKEQSILSRLYLKDLMHTEKRIVFGIRFQRVIILMKRLLETWILLNAVIGNFCFVWNTMPFIFKISHIKT